MPALHIRPMTRPELDLGIEWAAQEGWNPGLAPGFETARLYAGAAPALPMAQQFGVASFELG